MSTTERVCRVIADYCGGDVKPEANLVADLGMDSLDLLETVMAIEEEFGIELPDDDLEKLPTVADVVALVERVSGGAK